MFNTELTDFYAFGEMLWDCLPSGRHAGGAPFNVAAHLAQLGASASLISAVGQDPLGDELLQVAADKHINTQFVSRVRLGLPTGTVQVTLDAHANATYEIVRPVAWDEIAVPTEALDVVRNARALVFGSLAGRSLYNRDQLGRLLNVPGPLKFFDVNLRPPFADPQWVTALATQADVIKLNDDEIGQLASWIKTGEMTPNMPHDDLTIGAACTTLAEATQATRICVTQATGAWFWEAGHLLRADAPHVTVKDTVGAGDAFMAGLTVGLTRGLETQKVLEIACRLGAYVASHDGATPLLPLAIIQEVETL